MWSRIAIKWHSKYIELRGKSEKSVAFSCIIKQEKSCSGYNEQRENAPSGREPVEEQSRNSRERKCANDQRAVSRIYKAGRPGDPGRTIRFSR